MKVKLEDLVKIQSGYQAPSKYQREDYGHYRLVQVKDIDSNGEVKVDQLMYINTSQDLSKYLLSEGDILFQNRGHKLFSVVVKQELENCLAGGSFFLLRIKRKERVRAGFLAWILNHPRVKARLQACSRESSITFVPASELAQLNIEMPSLKTQEKIEKLVDLRRREAKIINEMESLKEKMVEGICYQLATGEEG